MIKGRFTMKYLFYLTLPCLLVAETSFITIMEYSSQLYKNPRGIGCQNCHGERGEGKLVAKYVHNKEKKDFAGPAINKMEWGKFYYAMNKANNGMPRYYLTEKEVQTLYLYLTEEKLRAAEKEEMKARKEEQKNKKVVEPKKEELIKTIEPKRDEIEVKKEENKAKKVEGKPTKADAKPTKSEPKQVKEAPKMLRYEDYPN